MSEDRLDRAVLPLVEAFSGEVGLALHRFSDGFRYGHRETEAGHAASLIKLPILVEALAQVEQGKLHLERRIELTADEVVEGTGILQALEPGLSLTLHELLTLMIVLSDNTATNLVLNQTGEEAVNARCRALGLSNTWLSGKLALPESRQNEAQRRGLRHRSSPADMLELLVRLQNGELLSGPMTRAGLAIMKKQRMTEALARYLPTDPELHDKPVTVASKSGCLRGVWHDAGIVYDRAGTPLYALAVMTWNAGDRGFGWEQEGMMLIARASRRIYEYLCEVKDAMPSATA